MKTTATDESQGKHYEVDVLNIKPLPEDRGAGGNIRTDYGDIDELAKSIFQNGIIMPLRAYRDKDNEGGWIAIDGHRRLAAAMKLVKEKGITIRAKVITVDSRKISDEQLIYDMITTNSGKQLSPVEMAEAVRRLIAYNHSVKDIAKGFGKPILFIQNLELLASAPKRVRDMVADKKISYSLVIQVMKETADFNEAIKIIEAAAGVAINEKVIKKNISASPEVPLSAKITKRHIAKAGNKHNSIKEAKTLLKDNPDREPNNQEVFIFLKKLVNNELSAAELEKILFD